MNLATRVDRIEEAIGIREPEDCRYGTTHLCTAGELIPADAARCPLCGAVHVLEITEEIIEPGEP